MANWSRRSSVGQGVGHGGTEQLTVDLEGATVGAFEAPLVGVQIEGDVDTGSAEFVGPAVGGSRGGNAQSLHATRGSASRRVEGWQGDRVPYRYSPRTYLQQPAFFGRRVDAEWQPCPHRDFAERNLAAASYYQHLAACETLRVAGQRRWGLDELAERLGARKDTLRRKLYGESPATIDDITR